MNILNNKVLITSDFDFEMFLSSLKSQLSSEIFTQLIQQEKDGIELQILMEIKDTQREETKKKGKEIVEILSALLEQLENDEKYLEFFKVQKLINEFYA